MHSLISNNKRKQKRSKFLLLAQSEVRKMVNAPTELEEKYCVCGELLTDCKDSYLHMSKGY